MLNKTTTSQFGKDCRRTHAGFEKASQVLKRSHRDLIVSKQCLRKAEGVHLVKMNREQRTQDLCFASRPFVLCGLPVRALPAGQLLYERRNGQFVLQITGHPKFGVPFGQDRIVPIFLATLAVQQKSPTIRFRSAGEMLETFGMHKGGTEYRRLVQAFERIFGATIFFGTDQTKGTAAVVQRSRFNFLQAAQLWFHKHADQPVISDEFENVITLSNEFYHEVASHPIPTDLNAVKVLASSPAVLDLFMWLSHRCFAAKAQDAIPIFGPLGLASQLGNVEYSRPRKFREKLQTWLDLIKAMWPECPAQISKSGEHLMVRPAAALIWKDK